MTQIMGILNCTPDSFYPGSRCGDLEDAVLRATQMVEEGAAWVDLGGESTRPGADPVPLSVEIDRVLPVVSALARQGGIPISVDTRHVAVMERAIDAGAQMINDVGALQEPGAVALLARSPQVRVCIMHAQGTPQEMQRDPSYTDCLREVYDFLQARLAVCLEAGIARDRIFLDPGFGFGKTLAHNLSLLQGLAQFQELGCPILVGVSRKRMLEALLGRAVSERLAGSLALGLWAAEQGAAVLRVHDVPETIDMLRIWEIRKHHTC